jgi:hypothetical protein
MISRGDQNAIRSSPHPIHIFVLHRQLGEREEDTSTSILIEGDCMNWAGYPWGPIRGGSARKGLCGN